MDTNRFFEPIRVGCDLNVLRQTTSIQPYDPLFNQENIDRLCSICQSGYNTQQIIRKINHCGHFYHINCLDQWFENNVKCPECQYDIRESIPRTNNNNTNESIYTFLLNNPFATSTPNTSNTSNTSTPQSRQRFQTLDGLLQNIIGNYSDTDISVEYYVPTLQPQPRTTQQPQSQPQQQSTSIPMDVTNANTNINRRTRNRRNRNKKIETIIQNYQRENNEKLDIFEKELESLRLQLENCKITNKYNPINFFRNLWN